MACECVERVNEALASSGMRLGLTIMLDGKPSRPTVMVEAVDKKRKTLTLIITNCPFCGEPYDEEKRN